MSTEALIIVSFLLGVVTCLSYVLVCRRNCEYWQNEYTKLQNRMLDNAQRSREKLRRRKNRNL